MNPEIKAKWVAALRSGEYKQGFQKLRPSDNEFCCLGVLCMVVGAKWDENEEEDTDAASILGESEVLPEYLARELGLCDRDPVVLVHGERRTLSVLNDGQASTHSSVRRHTFAEIAELIEEQL